jgi:hypothetical protein
MSKLVNKKKMLAQMQKMKKEEDDFVAAVSNNREKSAKETRDKKPKSKVDKIFKRVCRVAAAQAKGGFDSKVFQKEFKNLCRMLQSSNDDLYMKYFYEGLGKFPDEVFKK